MLIGFASSTTFGYNYLDNQPEGNITYENNTYINQTVNATVNTTQFDSANPIQIKTSWLTTFIESISKWTNYWSKTENINATGYNITATDFYSGTSKGLTQSFNMTNASLVYCQMNYTGGLLTASDC